MANQYPTTGSVTFGVQNYAGYITQTYDFTTKPAMIAEVFDENGIRKHVRYDDQTTEGTVEMVANGGSAINAGETISVNSALGSQKYEIVEVNVKGNNKNFVTYALKLKRSEGITLP